MKYNFKTDGIGFFEVLTVVFIVLKLLHQIDWSWWLVLSPILVQLILVLVILVVGMIITRSKYRR